MRLQHVLLTTSEKRTPWFEYKHVPLKWCVMQDVHPELVELCITTVKG